MEMTAKEECEELLNHILPAAEDLLRKNKEFYPVGAVLNNDNSVSFTATLEEGDFPDSESVISHLTEAHKTMAGNGEIKASGIAWNATITEGAGKKRDAIIVSLEHKENYSVIIGEPYSMNVFKKLHFDIVFAQAGKNDIWG
ncbi:MAG: hypothetical protein K6G27_02845 [Lachnospiraceae bacterium]|nr:hypothetical protein [Lachnospiraceae bacterium]